MRQLFSDFYAGQLIGDIIQVGIALYNLPSLIKKLPSILMKAKELLPQLLTISAAVGEVAASKNGEATATMSKAFNIHIDVAAEMVRVLGIPGAVVALGVAGAAGITDDIGNIMKMVGGKGASKAKFKTGDLYEDSIDVDGHRIDTLAEVEVDGDR